MSSTKPKPERLRILATSDVHMHMMSFDYLTETPTPGLGLSALSGTIENLRSAAQNSTPSRACMLVDNGDMLQGTPLSAHLAAQLSPDEENPTALVMNALGYDAMGLGNHDLDHGLAYLAQFAATLDAPLLSSNTTLTGGADWLLPFACHKIGQVTVGLVSVLPQRTLVWTYPSLGGEIAICDMRTAVRTAAQAARDAGADIVVALAHTGFGDNPEESALAQIAQDGAVDAIVGGHTHRVFPGSDHSGETGTDMTHGTLHGVPTVMPGFGAALVGCIDLDLSCEGASAWKVDKASAWVAPAKKSGRVSAPFLSRLEPAHTATQAAMNAPVGETSVALHSYFSLLQPTALLALQAEAQHTAIEEARQGTPYQDMPLLSAVSPARAGGRGGAWNYTDIAPGPLLARHVADLQSFKNMVWAVTMTGAELHSWLEKSAMVFATPRKKQTNALVDDDVPGFDFDTVFGLTYQIDPTRPPGDGAARVSDIRLNGAELEPDQTCLVAVNSYRACGGGQFPGLSPDRPVLRPKVQSEHVLRDFLSRGAPIRDDRPWRFADTAKGVTCWIDTGPGAVPHLHEIAHLSPGTPQLQPSGFLRVPLTL